MNINRDYLIINDVKKSNIKLDNGSMFFYITDKNTQNIFVNLVINVSNNDLIQKYANIENAEDYTLTMNIVKPDNTYKVVKGKLHDKEKAIFEFNLNEDCCDEIGTYRCELLTKCNINDHEEITTSNKLTYKVKSSVLNDLDDIVEALEYPLVIQLFDKLSDINQYEEDRRANELARQLAEEQRQARFDVLDADMSNRIEIIDNKLVEIDNVLISKEDIAEIKAKNTEQDNRLNVAENRLANIGNDITNTMQPIIDGHTSRLDAIEAVNVAQNNRLEAIEVKNQQQDDRLLDIEKINNRQNIDIKCLYGASQTIDVAKEGNGIYLQNSNNGFAVVDEIKGNTLVNCNKEPNKELILNGNINTSADNNVTITEGVNGGLVDVSLEGNTLVNVSKTKDSTALPLDEELTYLYANTQYTVQFISDKVITADITLGGTSLLAQSIVAGLNRIAITTPATLVDNKLIISGVGANISEVVVTDTDREFMYFEGMKSVGECEDNMIEILSTTNNLLDLSLIDGLVEEDGKIVAKRTVNGSNSSLKLKPNTRYKVTMEKYDDNPSWIGIGYTANGVYTSVGNSKNQPNRVIEFTTPNEKDIKFYIGANTLGDIGNYLRLIKLEYANSSSTSSIAKHNKKTMTHEPLRAVGNAKDRYVLIDGKWYIERNCWEYTIPQDTIWTKAPHMASGNYIRYWFRMSHIVSNQINPNNYKNFAISELLPQGNGWEWPSCNRNEMQVVKDTNEFFVQLDKTTIEEVASLLNGSKIIYRLDKPTYEPINYNPFTVYSDVTHISNNSTIPANMVIKNTGYNCLLKPSTTYTISSNLGLNTVTTPSTLTEDCLRFMDTDTSDVTTMKDVLVLEGDWTTKADLIPANFSGIESAFEQEYDAEKGKYKVNVKVANEDKSKENNITFYIDKPLRGVEDAKDRVYVKDDKVVVQRNCGVRAYEDGDFGTHLTDKVNTVYPLAESTYEEVEYNDTKLFIESFKNSTLSYNSNVPVTSKLYYSYSVPIVDTVAQTANVTDQQDSMIIDLATQVAVMEMMLM